MLPKCNVVVVLNVLFFTTITKFNTYAQSIKWPETWTADMSLKTSYCCGAKLDSQTIFISANESYVEENTEERPSEYLTLSFTDEELKELLALLKKHNVVGIKSSPSKNATLDKGTSSLNFTYAGKNYVANISPTEQLNTNAKERFYTITNYVDRLVEKKRITAKVNFIFKFDKSIIRSGKELRIKIENPPTDFTFKADGIPSSAVIDLVPGDYQMQVKLVNPGKLEESPEQNFSEATMKINTHENKQMTLFLEGQQLKYR